MKWILCVVVRWRRFQCSIASRGTSVEARNRNAKQWSRECYIRIVCVRPWNELYRGISWSCTLEKIIFKIHIGTHSQLACTFATILPSYARQLPEHECRVGWFAVRTSDSRMCVYAILIEWIKYKISRIRRQRRERERSAQQSNDVYMLFPFLFRAFTCPIPRAKEENRKWKIKGKNGKKEKVSFTALAWSAHTHTRARKQSLRSSN